MVADRAVRRAVADTQVRIRIFSEEGGWEKGEYEGACMVVTDPFDQSFPTTRTFRQAGMGICVADPAGRMLAVAVADFAVSLIYTATLAGAWVYTVSPNRPASALQPSTVTSLEEAFIVMPGSRTPRREVVLSSPVAAAAGRLYNTDGIVNYGRVAAGHIDGYLDPVIGKPGYEFFYAAIPDRAGAVVTDELGVPFDFSAAFRRFREDSDHRFRFAIGATPTLHRRLVEDWQGSG